MRKLQIAFSLVSLLPTTECIRCQSDPLSAIRDALATKYRLTTTTADKTGIVTAGSVLVLKKGNLLTARAESVVAPSNTYKGGKITQGLMGQIVNGAAATRTFVAGERLWVIGIDVKSKGIAFLLFSDPYSGEHYRASLTFPYATGAVLSATEAIAMISEALDIEVSANETAGERPAAAGQLVSTNQTNREAAKTATLVSDNTPWDPRYARLTSDDLQRINDPTVRLDLNYLRLNSAALEQKQVVQYFIALNNCNNRDVERALFNELDYPALAAYYKSKASQILASLSRTVTDLALYRYIGGQRSGNWVLWSKSLSLGEYDPQRKAFPLKHPEKDNVEISDSLSTESSIRDLSKSCPAAAKAARDVNLYLPATYSVSLKPAVYRELPMDQNAARKYIDRANSQRNVFLAVDVTILDSPPHISHANNGVSEASFRAQTARIRVIDANTLEPLGALFDDHSLPTDIQVSPAPPPSAAKPADRWAFGDHMYETRTAVYVFLVSDACSWPLTAEQNTNLRRFLEQMSTKGIFDERSQYHLSESRIKTAISAKGRANFCANPAERRDFDKLAATIAPLGPLAGPSSK